jgi:hypothetical protein
MLERAVVDDLDQLVVVQDLAVEEDRMRDLDPIVGEQYDEIGRRRTLARQTVGEGLTDLDLDIVDELSENFRHERALAVAQCLPTVEEEIADRGDERPPARDGLIARQPEKVLAVYRHARRVPGRDLKNR